LLWGLLGFAFISVSAEVADMFTKQGEVVDIDTAETVIQKFTSYLQLALGAIAMIFMFYAGFQLITRADDEEAVGKAKKHLIWSFIGLIIAILADPLVNKVFYPSGGDGGAGDTEVVNFTQETVGLLKFILSFLAILVFVAFLISGFYYLTSFGEEEKNTKAKDIIIYTIIGGILIIVSYALIAFFAGEA
jgi:Na+-driven multidrug efflux pump